jgi:hypothetical protein
MAKTVIWIPTEECDPGADQWVADRLSGNQRASLERLGDGDWHNAGGFEDGLVAQSLTSLLDFKRSRRGIMAPLGLVTREYSVAEKRYDYRITDFGKRVCALAVQHG